MQSACAACRGAAGHRSQTGESRCSGERHVRSATFEYQSMSERFRQIGFARTFVEAHEALPNEERKKVARKVVEFATRPGAHGPNSEKLSGKAGDNGWWTFRVDSNLRVVYAQFGAIVVLHWVGLHDEAYRWAERHRVTVHPVTATAQVVELPPTVPPSVPSVVSRGIPAASGPVDALPTGAKENGGSRDSETSKAPAAPLFGAIPEYILLQLGVPPDWIPVVKAIRSIDELLMLIGKIPDDVWERLVALANGEKPASIVDHGSASIGEDIADAVGSGQIAIARTEGELERILMGKWERWQVFLHPSQRGAVEADYAGPALVSGAAGTGKSVVAVHRAVRLARRSPNARVLLTTYTRKLADHLTRMVERLTEDDRVCRRIEVVNLDRKLRQLAGRLLPPFRIVEEAELADMLRVATEREMLDTSRLPFLLNEWKIVIDFWGIQQERDYVEVSREGRGVALNEAARRRLWPVFARVQDELRKRALYTWSGLAGAVTEALSRGGRASFEHVVVDEAQDLGPQQLRLVRALVAPGPNDLLLLGDWGQQIYKPRFPWIRLGIDVRGRSTRLKLCYRTTWQILQMANRVWFAGRPEESENPRDAPSVRDGPPPWIEGTRHPDEQIALVARWLDHCRRYGVEPREIAIVARTRSLLEQIGAPAARAAGMDAVHAREDADEREGGKVVLRTMHAVKGMEFRAVAVVGCSDEHLPMRRVLREAETVGEEGEVSRRERNLLYVAMTRARDFLLVTWSGQPSAFLAPVVR